MEYILKKTADKQITGQLAQWQGAYVSHLAPACSALTRAS